MPRRDIPVTHNWLDIKVLQDNLAPMMEEARESAKRGMTAVNRNLDEVVKVCIGGEIMELIAAMPEPKEGSDLLPIWRVARLWDVTT